MKKLRLRRGQDGPASGRICSVVFMGDGHFESGVVLAGDGKNPALKKLAGERLRCQQLNHLDRGIPG